MNICPNIFKMINIQHKSLYGRYKDEDNAKKHLSMGNHSGSINGEEHLGEQRVCVGGIIITSRKIGQDYANKFNERQKLHIKSKTFGHKILCERRDEAVALLFLTIEDFLGEYISTYNTLSNKELCNIIRYNIQKIIEQQLPWVSDYSKYIIHEYYGLFKHRLKYKLNFLLDDGVYSNEERGGLMINGLLEQLDYYNDTVGRAADTQFGMLCQVLCPSGLPENKKWIQIDVGISFSGKRNYKESVLEALLRESKEEIHIKVLDPIVVNTAFIPEPFNYNMFYGGQKDGGGCEGFDIHIWEVFYGDQIELDEEVPLDYTFCKCNARLNIIKKID